ncbi:MAG: NAD(P)-dependent oxidoreductase [Synergistaceae bacterium]|jgi:3-hydroxyisobutyrate dehydrogenase|nr:NAD(P)-dependent oxidoreductase [Synergistaceae bacterium]
MPKETIGFIGVGVMGGAMAGHLIDSGYSLNVYNRTREKSDGLVERGAVWRDSPGEVAAHSDIVITIVGYPKDVEEVYLGHGGIIERAAKGALLIDMTTSSPALAVRISERARERGAGACDAPVTGGDKGAREATLAILAGGEEVDFKRALPVFQAMGKKITHFGPAGCGQTAKLANQIIIAGTMLGVCEGLAFAKKLGIDPEKLLDCASSGSAGSWSLANYGPRILNGDFAPGFFIKHFVKDMKLARESAEGSGISLEGLRAALAQYEKAAEEGGGENGTQYLYKLYDK